MELNSELDRLRRYSDIERELQRSNKKHGELPDNLFEKIVIMQEEAGEVAKAALHLKYEKGKVDELREELVQTAAMCMKIIDDIDNDKKHIFL